MLATTEFHLIQPRKLAFFIRDRLDFRLVITAINWYPLGFQRFSSAETG